VKREKGTEGTSRPGNKKERGEEGWASLNETHFTKEKGMKRQKKGTLREKKKGGYLVP